MIDRRTVLGAGAAFAAIPIAPLGAQTQVAGVYRRAVGDITVTALLDGYLELDAAMLVGADAETRDALLADAFLEPGRPVDSAINAYVVEAGGRVIVVDAGAAGAMGPTAGNFPAVLAAAGVDPAAVDVFFVTHLHPDHVGGALDGGAATFPNAELIAHEAEPAFWTDEGNFAGADEMVRSFAAMAEAALAPYAGATTLVGDGAEIAPGVTVMHLPGHTPGHSGLMLASGAASTLLWADIVHVGPIQFARPEVTIPFDVDQPTAAATRARVFDMAATDRLEIGGSHVVFPSFGRLRRAGEGFDFEPSRWDYRV